MIRTHTDAQGRVTTTTSKRDTVAALTLKTVQEADMNWAYPGRLTVSIFVKAGHILRYDLDTMPASIKGNLWEIATKGQIVAIGDW